tara:strand:+ start:515 stop:766 length:252 start_codon:yes stop_codon:yes gene_type:complete
MSNTRSAKKDLKQSKRKNSLHFNYKKEIKEAEKSGDLQKIQKTYDKAAKKGIISAQRAGRKKSQASQRLQASTGGQKTEASQK